MTQSADNDAGQMPPSRSHPNARQVQTFGRRKGRKLSPAQQRLVDEILPALRIDLTGAAAPAMQPSGQKDGWGQNDSWLQRLFDDRPPDPGQEIWLEIGFGGGEHLVWQAAQNPHINFIGCEPFLDGVVKVLRAVEREALPNIRIYDDDARDLLRRIPSASIDRAFILFPDPWPKKRQQKRRLVGAATLDLLARVMKPGTELRIGTDIDDYARAILLGILRHPAFHWPAMRADDWRVRPPDWPQTRYEQKARAAGRSCSYFSFRRRPDG